MVTSKEEVLLGVREILKAPAATSVSRPLVPAISQSSKPRLRCEPPDRRFWYGRVNFLRLFAIQRAFLVDLQQE